MEGLPVLLAGVEDALVSPVPVTPPGALLGVRTEGLWMRYKRRHTVSTAVRTTPPTWQVTLLTAPWIANTVLLASCVAASAVVMSLRVVFKSHYNSALQAVAFSNFIVKRVTSIFCVVMLASNTWNFLVAASRRVVVFDAPYLEAHK